MPVLKRRPRLRSTPAMELTIWRRDKLITGYSWDFLLQPREMPLCDEDLRVVWETNRVAVLAYVFGEYNAYALRWKPYQKNHFRPWAWWKWDAPEPRRVLSVRPDIDASAEGLNDPLKQIHHADSWESLGIAVVEAEVDYLARLGLLTETELEILNT